MRRYEKIKIIFDDYIILNTFWTAIDFSKKEENIMFIQKLRFLLKNSKVDLHKKVLYSLKPFVKICKKRKKYKENIEKNFSNKNNFFNKKNRKIINKTILIKYKYKVVYVYPSNNKKYTYVITNIAKVNFFNFLTQFVEKWNKYHPEFEVYIKNEEIKRINVLKKDKYIDYFTNYYDSLK